MATTATARTISASALCKCKPNEGLTFAPGKFAVPRNSIHKKKKVVIHGVHCEAIRSRRQVCLESAGAMWALLCGIQSQVAEAEAKEIQVGSYLPPAPSNEGFVQFKATNKDTPALRAGNVELYQFILPSTWKQVRVANILSGNYCQPKCAEPWVEAKFEDPNQGTVQVVAAPLIRLTNKLNAQIEEIGNPEKLIASLGPFVTGNSFDPDELVESNVERHNDQTYYSYTLETPYALTGTHNLAKATAK
ncbi:hypothetical protein KI387_022638, partial [Taxus chinensis]